MPPILFSSEEPECDRSWNSKEGIQRFCKLLGERVKLTVTPDLYYSQKIRKICMSKPPGRALEAAIADALNYEAEFIISQIAMRARFEDINKVQRVREVLDWQNTQSGADRKGELKNKDLSQSQDYARYLQEQQKFRMK